MLAGVFLPVTPAQAHGACGQDYPIAFKSAIWSEPRQDYAIVRGFTRFHCRDDENHAEMRVLVRLFECRYTSSSWPGCSGSLDLLVGNSNTCGRGEGCITSVAANCRSWHRYIAYGRWAAFNQDGQRVHENAAYPDLNRELPNPLSGKVGIYC
jgi:hypothetical protein